LLDKESIGDTYTFGNNLVDFKAQDAITFDGKKVELSKKEAQLLKLIVRE
jgi:two-component system alkaline phosphatase synthesis response regulator PhoP